MLQQRFWILVASLLLVGSAPLPSTQSLPVKSCSSEDCKLCAGQHQWACRRCEGKGQRATPCTRCGGDHKIECPVRGCIKGKLSCNACYGEGKITWQTGDKDSCKVCSRKGKVTCGFCTGKGKFECPKCGKSGKASMPCQACAATGVFPCPKSRAARCVVCKGHREYACRSCAGRGEQFAQCDGCKDYGLLFCEKCFHGRTACTECHGTGKLRYVGSESGARAGTHKCGPCGGRGYSQCKRCDKGVRRCDLDHPRTPCKDCQRGMIDCARC